MTVLMALPGSLLWRAPKDGDAFGICRDDVTWPPPRLTTPGRDCPACPAPREAHDGWGAPTTGCELSIALITRRPL